MHHAFSRRIAGKMHYFTDQKGIIERYINEKENWDNHLTHCRNFLINTLKDKSYSTISILGSGWLLDIPIDFLAAHFRKICLYDIRHPRQVLHRLGKSENFELITADITGGFTRQAWDMMKTYKRTKTKPGLDSIKYPVFEFTADSDCYVSVNILNQLDILIADFLKKNCMYSETELMPLRKAIQEAHIRCLPGGKSYIISDYEELIYDMDDRLIEKKTLVYAPLPESENRQKWQWVFDTQGIYNRDHKTVFNVFAQEI